MREHDPDGKNGGEGKNPRGWRHLKGPLGRFQRKKRGKGGETVGNCHGILLWRNPFGDGVEECKRRWWKDGAFSE